MNPVAYFIGTICGMAIAGAITYSVAKSKNKENLGAWFFVGAMTGVIGLIIVLCSKTEEPKNESNAQVSYTQQSNATIQQPVQYNANNPTDSVEDRLKRLKALLDNGYITQSEYEEKKTDVLKDL